MCTHLSDMTIAMLVAAGGNHTLRSSVSEHLDACSVCRERVAAALRFEREAPREDNLTSSTGLEGDTADRLMRAFADELAPRESQRESSSVILLERIERSILDLPDAHVTDDQPLPLAADESTSDVDGGLPVLANDDRSLIVRFRRSQPDENLRAYVITRKGSLPGSVVLHFPARNISFPVGNDGEAVLTGIGEKDLSTARLHIFVEPMDSDESDTS